MRDAYPGAQGRPLVWLGVALALLFALITLYVPFQFYSTIYRFTYPFLKPLGFTFGTAAILLSLGLASVGLPRWLFRAGQALLVLGLGGWIVTHVAAEGLGAGSLSYLILFGGFLLAFLWPEQEPLLFRLVYGGILTLMGSILIYGRIAAPASLYGTLPVWLGPLFLIPGLLQPVAHWAWRDRPRLGWSSMTTPAAPFLWYALFWFQSRNWLGVGVSCILAASALAQGLYLRRPWQIRIPALRRKILALGIALAVVPALGLGALAVHQAHTQAYKESLTRLRAAVQELERETEAALRIAPDRWPDAIALFRDAAVRFERPGLTPVILPIQAARPQWQVSNEIGTTEESLPGRPRIVTAYIRRPDLGLVIAVMLPASQALAGASSTAISILLGTVLFALAASALSLLLSARITGQLTRIQHILGDIESSRFTAHVLPPADTVDDEVASLTAAIARMAASLETSISSLRVETTRREDERRRLSAVLSALPVGVIIASAKDRSIQVNRSTREIWAMDDADPPPLGQQHMAKGWWGDSQLPIATDEWPLNQALATGATSLAREIIIEALDGTRKIILHSSAPVLDESGAVVDAVSVLVDITKRKEMEEALRARESRLAGKREVFELIATDQPLPQVLDRIARFAEEQIQGGWCSIFLLEENGSHLRLAAGPSMREPFWRSAERIPVQPERCANGRAVATKAMAIWGTSFAVPILAPGGEVLGTVELLYRDQIVPPEAHMQVAGIVTHMAAVAIEHHRRGEQRSQKLQSLIHHMGEGVIAVDDGRRLLFINPAARGLLGLSSVSDGQPLAELGLPSPLAQEIERVTEPGAYGATRVTFSRGDRSIEAHVSPVVAELGRYGAIAVLQDVTTEVQFRRLQESFVANVSHELRGPLAAISATLEAVADGMVPERDRPRYFKAMMAEMARLRRLSHDVIDLTRLDAGVVQLRTGRVQLGSLFETLRDRFAMRCREAGIHLTIEPTDLAAVGDGDRVDQVLTNLVDNAIRFTRPGGMIRLFARAESGMLRVAIADTGIGIPQEHLPHIWERFYKVDQARTLTPDSGTGLGLAIVRQLVERMGGGVAVQSEPGQGSVFSFTLPRAGPPSGTGVESGRPPEAVSQRGTPGPAGSPEPAALTTAPPSQSLRP